MGVGEVLPENFYDKPTKVEGETILSVVQKRTDEIMNALNRCDCSEMVVIHVSKNMEFVRLSINNETYIRFGTDKWKQI